MVAIPSSTAAPRPEPTPESSPESSSRPEEARHPAPRQAWHRRSFFSGVEEDFRQLTRDFLAREVDGNLTAYASGALSMHELWRRAAEAGVIATGVPEQYGGLGQGPILNFILSHELSRTPGFGVLGPVLTTDNVTQMIFRVASERICRTIAPLVLDGAIQAMGLTEPDAGTDSLGIRTKARLEGDEWVINGGKVFISSGAEADLLYVIAKTDPELGRRGLSAFLVHAGTPGLTQRRVNMLGMSGTGLGEWVLDDVRVPDWHLIGERGQALELFSMTMSNDRVHCAGRALGQAELALSMTVDYVKTRTVAGGRPLFDFQNTKMKLAEIAVDVEAATALVVQSLDKVRAHRCTPLEAATVKVFAQEMSARVLDTCVQLWGAHGLAEEQPLSHMFANNRTMRVLAGTSELLKLSVAARL